MRLSSEPREMQEDRVVGRAQRARVLLQRRREGDAAGVGARQVLLLADRHVAPHLPGQEGGAAVPKRPGGGALPGRQLAGKCTYAVFKDADCSLYVFY